MLDFTSALYLGFRHASSELPTWSQLTTGVPAAMAEPSPAASVAARLALLVGTEAGVLTRSTLHAFWDMVLLLATPRSAVLVDRGSYPIARAGVERAVVRGVPALEFAHFESDDLRRVARHQGQPLIVTDGICPGCGRTAPLRDYVEVAKQSGGCVLVDDTQALGLVGPHGGGSLRELGRSPLAVYVASLSKAFGAPLAFIGGTRSVIHHYRERGETRMHMSPPSLADLGAASHALDLNATRGDTRRSRLRALIDHLRSGFTAIGLPPQPGVERTLFPVQKVPLPLYCAPADVHARLLRAGVRGVLHRGCDGLPRLSLVLTALHTPAQVDRAVMTLASSC